MDITYIPKNTEEKKKIYYFIIDAIPIERNMKDILNKLYELRAVGVISIMGTLTRDANRKIYVFCNSLNNAKIARNLIESEGYTVGYPEEINLPDYLIDKMYVAKTGYIKSIDRTVNLIEQYASND